MTFNVEFLDGADVTLYFDPAKPDEQNFYFPVVVVGFGQMNMVIPKSLLEPADLYWFENAEIGKSFASIINFPKYLAGYFTRYRKTPTSPIIRRFVLTSITNQF